MILFSGISSQQNMALSADSIIAIVGVIVSLPPSAIVVWKIICRCAARQHQVDIHSSSEDLEPLHPITTPMQSPPPYELPQWQWATSIGTRPSESRRFSSTSLKSQGQQSQAATGDTKPQEPHDIDLPIPLPPVYLPVHGTSNARGMSQVHACHMV